MNFYKLTIDYIASLPVVYKLCKDDNFGTRLKKIRKGKNISSKEIEEKTGIVASTLISYENGGCYPSYEKYKLLLEILGEEIKTKDIEDKY